MIIIVAFLYTLLYIIGVGVIVDSDSTFGQQIGYMFIYTLLLFVTMFTNIEMLRGK